MGWNIEATVGDLAVVGDFETSPSELSVDVREAPEVLLRERPRPPADVGQASPSF